MSTTLFDQVLRAAQRLTPQEQQELIERLWEIDHKRPRSILDVLPLDNVGSWPEDLSLRREDMYGDDMHNKRQRPSQTLRVFHVDQFPEHMTLWREDEYDDDAYRVTDSRGTEKWIP